MAAWTRLSLLALALAALAGPSPAPAAVAPAAPPSLERAESTRAQPGGEFVAGELLVRFRAGVDASEQAQALRAQRARVERGLPLAGLKLVRLPPAASVPAVAAALERNPNVAYAEPNFVRGIAARMPNDPRFGELWGLANARDADIDAPEAWGRTTGSRSVTVAVVDTGIAYDHPDLAANMWTNPGEVENGADDDANGRVERARMGFRPERQDAARLPRPRNARRGHGRREGKQRSGPSSASPGTSSSWRCELRTQTGS